MVKNAVSFKSVVVENATSLISHLVESKTDVQVQAMHLILIIRTDT
jgi:hypothetical protein